MHTAYYTSKTINKIMEAHIALQDSLQWVQTHDNESYDDIKNIQNMLETICANLMKKETESWNSAEFQFVAQKMETLRTKSYLLKEIQKNG